MKMPIRTKDDNRRAQLIRLPGKVRALSREEIEKAYPSSIVVKDSRLTTSYRGPCDKGPDQVYIYGMADPRDHVIRYVGKTSLELGARLDWHLKEPTNRGMAEWLGELWLCGIRPEIAVLEICHVSKWEASERAWIARMRKVGRMLNVEDGGESCHHHAVVPMNTAQASKRSTGGMTGTLCKCEPAMAVGVGRDIKAQGCDRPRPGACNTSDAGAEPRALPRSGS